jgi:hypothetical protein
MKLVGCRVPPSRSWRPSSSAIPKPRKS